MGDGQWVRRWSIRWGRSLDAIRSVEAAIGWTFCSLEFHLTYLFINICLSPTFHLIPTHELINSFSCILSWW